MVQLEFLPGLKHLKQMHDEKVDAFNSSLIAFLPVHSLVACAMSNNDTKDKGKVLKLKNKMSIFSLKTKRRKFK